MAESRKMMDNVFGKYRVIIPKITRSPNPAYHGRSGPGYEWNYIVKVYTSRPVHSQEEEEAFDQHIATLSQLENPHILSIIEHGFEKNIPFYVTAYLPKGSLRKHLEQDKSIALSIQEMITIIVQVGEALQYAHDRHIIHGNIKPENILFDANNNAQLVDFYLPENIGELANDNVVPFSYYPKHETLNEKSDQYALGSLANELFSKLLPTFTQASLLQQDTTGEMLTPTFSRSLNEALRQVKTKLIKAMAKDPDERYKDIATFVAALNEIDITTTSSQAAISATAMLIATPVPGSSSFYNAKTMPGHIFLPQRKPFALMNYDPKHRLLFIVALVLILGLLSSGSVWLLVSGKTGKQTAVLSTSPEHVLAGKSIKITPQTISTAPQPTTMLRVSPTVAPTPTPRPKATPSPRPTANPLTAMVVGSWNFDEGSGSIASDSSGNNHSGKLRGDATWGPPHTGFSALSLDGNYGNVDISSPVVDTAQSFSVTAWVKVSEFNNESDQTFVSIDGNQVSAFNLQWRSDTQSFAFTRSSNDGDYAESYVASAASFPQTDTWYNLAGVYNARAQTIALYVNGHLQQTVFDTNVWQAGGHTEIGRALFNGRRIDFVIGEIDEVYIYQGALTASNVASLAAAG